MTVFIHDMQMHGTVNVSKNKVAITCNVSSRLNCDTWTGQDPQGNPPTSAHIHPITGHWPIPSRQAKRGNGRNNSMNFRNLNQKLQVEKTTWTLSSGLVKTWRTSGALAGCSLRVLTCIPVSRFVLIPFFLLGRTNCSQVRRPGTEPSVAFF